MSDSYDDYEAKIQLAEHAWEKRVVKTEHDRAVELAREAGLCVGTNLSGVVLVGSPAEIGLAHLTIEELERFAALVAAHEREACAKVCDDMDHNGVMIAADCAEAIRERGNT